MHFLALLLASLVLLPALGLVTWALLVLAQVEDEMRTFSEADGRHAAGLAQGGLAPTLISVQ